jgi:hypothetical protein
MTLRRGAWAALGALAAAAVGGSPEVAAAQAAPLELAPAAAWTADFAAESCALRRRFGDGTHTVVFEISQVAPDDGLEIKVASATLEYRDRPPRTQFLPGGTPDEAAFYRPFATVDGLEGFARYDTMRPSDYADGDSPAWAEGDRDARERAITGYSVARAFDQDLVIQTGPMHEPMKVMRACLDDLASQWGLDPAAQRTLSRRAEVDFDAGWVTRIVQLQRQLVDVRSPASVRARLLVDETGKVTDCQLLNLSPNSDDAHEFCGEMERRARLTPALDSGGQPVRSFYIWQILMATRTTVSTIN